jgi:hypothetical protein
MRVVCVLSSPSLLLLEVLLIRLPAAKEKRQQPYQKGSHIREALPFLIPGGKKKISFGFSSGRPAFS